VQLLQRPAAITSTRSLDEKAEQTMGYAIGSVLAIVVSLFAKWVGLDRDRAFYPTVLIVVGHYYVLFAVMGGSTQALVIEAGAMIAFLLAAVIGFKFNLWIVATALVGHGVFDFFHAHIITNPGVPHWWPAFCMAFDVCAGACLGWIIKTSDSSSN
jgi:hypothetical protein